MRLNPLVFKNSTSYTLDHYGLFAEIQHQKDATISVSSSQQIDDLEAILDIDSKDYANKQELSVPLNIDFDLGQYYVVVSSYMIRGVPEWRRIRDFKIFGKKSIDTDWKEIDSKTRIEYCGILSSRHEDCANDKMFFIDSPVVFPFNQIRFQMISDGLNDTSDVRFRLMAFEMYGTLLQKVISHHQCHLSPKPSYLFIFVINET